MGGPPRTQQPRSRGTVAGRTLAQALASRDNSFDLLRVTAALAVVVSHSFPLSGSRDPFDRAVGITLGTTAVIFFFSLSGYLITASWLADAKPRVFLTKRALRIMPGLMVSAIVTAFVIGPLATTLSFSDYFTHVATYLYPLKQFVLDVFVTRLPGVFTHNPVPDRVNDSLWTIPVEVCCYLSILLFATLGLLRRPKLLVWLFAISLVMMAIGQPPDNAYGHGPQGFAELLTLQRVCACFLGGSLIRLYQDRVPFHPVLLALALVAIFGPWPLAVHSTLDVICVPYAVVMIGSIRPGRLAFATAAGDVSYGTYIFAYPIMQLLVLKIPGISAIALMAISLPICWLAGLVSWRLVERRALGLKRIFVGQPPQHPAATESSEQALETPGVPT